MLTNSSVMNAATLTIGSQLRNMAIPSPPSLSSSSEEDDSDGISDDETFGVSIGNCSFCYVRAYA